MDRKRQYISHQIQLLRRGPAQTGPDGATTATARRDVVRRRDPTKVTIIGKQIRIRHGAGARLRWRLATIASFVIHLIALRHTPSILGQLTTDVYLRHYRYSSSRRAFLLVFRDHNRGLGHQHRNEWVDLMREHKRVTFVDPPYEKSTAVK